MKLLGKIIIKGKLTTLTGLHLGGSKSSLNIGGIDNNVIKDAKGKPYIPGSSIKGKLRSLLAKAEGSLYFTNKARTDEVAFVTSLLNKKEDAELAKYKNIIEHATTDEACESLISLFGYSGDASNTDRVGYTRLLVRDAFLANEDSAIFQKLKGYTDSKWENVIDRKTGTAEHPRQLERVPVGAEFGLELVYNIYEDSNNNTNDTVTKHLNRLLLALQLLQDDGIGGSISRGYGQVRVSIDTVDYKLIDPATMKYEINTPTDTTQVQLLSEFTNEFANPA